MVQYYTLEQAAQILRTTPDELKEMAKRNEVRAFQDRGTLRFRAQEINELARLKGLGSDPELQLGEGAAPPKTPGPKSPGKSPGKGTGKQTAFAPGGAGAADFSLDPAESDEVPIGKEPAAGAGKSHGRDGGKPPSSKGSTKSPPPKAASDSDVRLVMDGGDLDFQIAVDSDVSVAKDPASAPKTPGKTPGKKSAVRPPEKGDSGVRIVPLDRPSDSDVRIDGGVLGEAGRERAKTPSDSDIRLEGLQPVAGPRDGGSDDAMVTEEIDLDAESRRAAESGTSKAGKRPRSKVTPPLPTSSPYELSENDITVEAPKTPGKAPKSAGKAPKGPKTPEKKPKSPEDKEGETDSSSDFELTPLGESSSPLEPGSSGEIPIMTDDDEVTLGELTGTSGGSGINLRDPVDSGISLEQGGSDEIDFELSLDAGASHTPKPKPAASPENVDSSSEFELSLDPDSSPVASEDSDSEFELSLDADGSDVDLKSEADSSSEFELTLDEDGGLAPVDESSSVEAEGEQDIFETDFEVPALDEESGSEAVALEEGETDLESSDFDLSLNEEDASASGEGGSESQVVALEDEEAEADSGAATVARPRRAVPSTAAAESEEELADIEQDLEGEPEEEEAAVAAAPAAAAPPREWGVLPALVLFPCTIVLFVVGLMSFEMIQGLWGYHRGAKVSKLLVDPIARMFDDTLPKD